MAELISHVRSSHLPTSSSGPLSASVSISVWLMHLRLFDGTQTYFRRAASSRGDCPSHWTTHTGHLGSHRIWNPAIVNLRVKTCRPWIHLNLNLVVQPLLYLLYYGYLIWGPGFYEECELQAHIFIQRNELWIVFNARGFSYKSPLIGL